MQTSQVKSATRAIEILDFFKRTKQRSGMSEIAQALGYPQSSTTVLLKTLVSLGYLNFDRVERLYFPTPKVTSLGDWIPRALFGSTRMLEAMHDVHAATGETVSINTRNDIYLQYVQIIQSIHAMRFHVDEGTLRFLTHSVVGWVLLSTLPDEKIDNIVRRTNIAIEKPGERIDIARIMAEVAKIRKQGYGYTENLPFLGGATLCVLMPATIQNQPATLGLGGVADRVRANKERYLGVLQRAAGSVQPTDPFEMPVSIEF
ncbi:transcriptional regulator [Zhengella mangrovi]|uniref:Transcriptional regulator n=1 Tax=Zhengella mangrovi TaxID=1982044 RepID=A0A2G1QIC9_9HYPH|nr:helix-turn-helix domain-containing protein [Zhengella mangrovi]PHP65239.1 transcriptional regulator [Zhengella mangrovi]